jgi:hypothetical protein
MSVVCNTLCFSDSQMVPERESINRTHQKQGLAESSDKGEEIKRL